MYEVLGVAERAPAHDIKQAFRRRALALHPDKVRAQGAEPVAAAQAFRALQAAYELLSDPEQRADYDRRRAQDAERLRLQQERSNVEFLVVSLDDLVLLEEGDAVAGSEFQDGEQEEQEEVYGYDCRCGDVIRVPADLLPLDDEGEEEQQPEQAAGQTVFSCETCSLSIKVQV